MHDLEIYVSIVGGVSVLVKVVMVLGDYIYTALVIYFSIGEL